MWTLRKTTNDEKLLAILEARYKENQNNPQKMKGLAARLQAMQEQQAELQKQREELARKRKSINYDDSQNYSISCRPMDGRQFCKRTDHDW